MTVTAALLLTLIFASSAFAQADIQSAGPLTDIWIGEDLSCQVAHAGDSNFEFYDPQDTSGADCGTSVSIGDQLFSFSYFDASQWVSDGQSPVTGAGTTQKPYQVETDVHGGSGSVPSGLAVKEVDSYVVGTDYYQTDITLTNNDPETSLADLKVYHSADCYLQGSDEGYGFVDPSSGAVACTQSPNDSPAALLEEFTPLSPGSHHVEDHYSTVNSYVENTSDLPDTCECTTLDDNGMALSWNIASLDPGHSVKVSLLSSFSATGVIGIPIVASGGSSLTGTAGSTVSGTVASVNDPNAGDTASSLSATINWGDGSSSAGTITGGNDSFNVTGSHPYASSGSYPITVTITRVGDSANTATATGSAVITSVPTPVVTGSTTPGVTAAGFTGSVVPGGLPTTASFQYGLDPKYTGGGPLVYTDSTGSQPVGSDFSSHPVSASVSNLVPNALYHVRLVATNSAGTTFGPDSTFTTNAAPPPRQPTLGQTFNVKPVSGVVLIEINGRFVPLTQLSQIPQNAVINALHGTLQLITAAGGGQGARDAAAKRGKKHRKVKTQSGTFGGAVFKVKQAHNGLTTLSLVEGAVKGGPSFSNCKAPHKAADATAAALSSKTLQLLHASAKGKYSTKGRYGAATVRGTTWTIADRCNGTLVHDITHSVAVTDFVRHKTIILHAGQSYLAKARK